MNFNDINLSQAQARPVVKIDPTEVNTRTKYLRLKFLINSNLSIGDTITGVNIPEGAVVLDAGVYIPASLGAGGRLSFGHAGGNVISTDESIPADEQLEQAIAADPDAFVLDADAGGQAVLEKAGAGSVILSQLGKVGLGGLPLQLTVLEAPTTADTTPVLVEAWVEYALEF